MIERTTGGMETSHSLRSAEWCRSRGDKHGTPKGCIQRLTQTLTEAALPVTRSQSLLDPTSDILERFGAEVTVLGNSLVDRRG